MITALAFIVGTYTIVRLIQAPIKLPWPDKNWEVAAILMTVTSMIGSIVIAYFMTMIWFGQVKMLRDTAEFLGR